MKFTGTILPQVANLRTGNGWLVCVILSHVRAALGILGAMKTKLDQIREAAAAGDWPTALRIAARFPRLGEHKRAIVAAHEALAHPGFYSQLGKDPAALVEAGKAALRVRYSL